MTKLLKFLLHAFIIGYLGAFAVYFYSPADSALKFNLLRVCLVLTLPQILVWFFYCGKYLKAEETKSLIHLVFYYFSLQVMLTLVLKPDNQASVSIMSLIIFLIMYSLGKHSRKMN